MHAIEFVELRKRYGTVHALRGISFAVEPGEVFGFLGPNGAGKTTALRIALDLVRASHGHVILFGESARSPRSRERLGYLPGDLRLWGDLSGAALLDTFARLRPSRPPVLRERLLVALGLGPAELARRAKQLSHGTRQKLGLVIAMQHDPDLLLLDEPSNGLDPLVQRALLDLLAERAGAGRAVLFSSHVLSEVEAVCGRVALLRDGALVSVASVDMLREGLVRHVHVRLRSGVAAAPRDLAGVTVVACAGRSLELRLAGDPGPLLRWLATQDVEDVRMPEPRLEDAFLAHYGRDGGAS